MFLEQSPRLIIAVLMVLLLSMTSQVILNLAPSKNSKLIESPVSFHGGEIRISFYRTNRFFVNRTYLI